MSTLLEAPVQAQETERPEPAQTSSDSDGWLVFQYAPASLFSLKNSRATSTTGKTLLTATPYAVKMAFLDVTLRHRFTDDPDTLIHSLAQADLRIGVPEQTCVTGTIQSVRQETRDAERKRNPDSPPYRSTISMREFVHCRGTIRIAFDLKSCTAELVALLIQAAPAINYLGKRGSFIQYLHGARQQALDPAFTEPVEQLGAEHPHRGHRAMLDDFGPKASFAALNSFASTEVRRELDRKFVETMIPLNIYNSGPGFVHYTKAVQ